MHKEHILYTIFIYHTKTCKVASKCARTTSLVYEEERKAVILVLWGNLGASIAVESVDSGTRIPGLSSQLCHFLVV